MHVLEKDTSKPLHIPIFHAPDPIVLTHRTANTLTATTCTAIISVATVTMAPPQEITCCRR